MKILQVSNFLTPVHGGSAEVPFQISKELAKNGHDVTIYTANLDMEESFTLPGVNIAAFDSRVSFAGFNYTPDMIKKAREKIDKFDVIHMHNFRTFQNMIAHHYAKKYCIPYVIQAHGSLTTFFQKGWLKKCFDVFWGNWILRDAAVVFALNEMEANQCQEIGVPREKIEIVPNGIDLLQFRHLPEAGTFRHRYDLDEKQRIILYLGRLNRIKGLDLLVRAFAGVLKRCDNVKLVIAGPDSGCRPALEAQAHGLGITRDILFTGPLYGEAKLAAFVAGDVFVLPSSYDIFGVTVIEAMACSRPVIITDRCGLANVVKDTAGLVVPYDNTALESAMISLLEDTPLRVQYGRRGRMLVTERYNWENIVRQINIVYRRVAGQST